MDEFFIKNCYGGCTKFEGFGGLAFEVDFGVYFAVGLPGFVVGGQGLVFVSAAVGGFFDGVEPDG